MKSTLTLKDKSPVAGVPVSLEIKRSNESSWTSIAEFVSGVDGSVSVPVTIGANASFRFTTQGTWERAESLSNEGKVVLLSRIVLDRPTSVKSGKELSVKGTLLPVLAGQVVVLQKFVSGKWQNIGTATTTGANGEFQVSLIEAKKGVIKLRVQITTKDEQVLTPEFTVVVR